MLFYLKEVTKQAPRWSDGWNNLGLAYADNNNYDSLSSAVERQKAKQLKNNRLFNKTSIELDPTFQ